MKINRFGILVPNYNGAAFIGDTLLKLMEGFPESKIVVVDDYSTDESLTVLKELKIFVIKREKNGGYAASVNSGLRYFQSHGYRYVLIANSDINIKKADCAAIHKSIIQFSNDSMWGVLGFVENNDEAKFNEKISGFLFLLNLNVLDSIGYFDEKFYMYGEEQDFFRRVISAGFMIYQTGIHVDHVGEMSPNSKLRNSWYAIRNSIYIEAKTLSIIKVFLKLAALFAIINRVYTPKKIDFSLKRIRRPGILIGNFFLISAVIWNSFNLFLLMVSHVKSKFR